MGQDDKQWDEYLDKIEARQNERMAAGMSLQDMQSHINGRYSRLGCPIAADTRRFQVGGMKNDEI